MNPQRTTSRRSKVVAMRGFTVMEIAVAMALLAVAMVLVMQLGYWSVRHRARMACRFMALEHAANVLEEARTVPWENLTDDWAESQRLPQDLTDQLLEGTLAVRVEPLEAQPFTKRVSVELRWLPPEETESHAVRLLGLFSRRTVAMKDMKQ
jgi:prepilin-type N-terminal cleavage/methylation domain-containing protein